MLLRGSLFDLVERAAEGQPRPFRMVVTDPMLADVPLAARINMPGLLEPTGETVDPTPVRAILDAATPSAVRAAIIRDAHFRWRGEFLFYMDGARPGRRSRTTFTVSADNGPITCDVSVPPPDWRAGVWLLNIVIHGRHPRLSRIALALHRVVSRLEAATRRWPYNLRGWRTIPRTR